MTAPLAGLTCIRSSDDARGRRQIRAALGRVTAWSSRSVGGDKENARYFCRADSRFYVGASHAPVVHLVAHLGGRVLRGVGNHPHGLATLACRAGRAVQLGGSRQCADRCRVPPPEPRQRELMLGRLAPGPGTAQRTSSAAARQIRAARTAANLVGTATTPNHTSGSAGCRQNVATSRAFVERPQRPLRPEQQPPALRHCETWHLEAAGRLAGRSQPSAWPPPRPRT